MTRTWPKSRPCQESKEQGVRGAESIQEFVALLRQPRAIMMLVPAGAPVDSVINDLSPHLDKGDLIIDAGNSYFKDTDVRRNLAAKGIQFLGVGVSGGEEGARHGPSIMPGGRRRRTSASAPSLKRLPHRAKSKPGVVYGNNNWATSVYCVTPDYLTIRDLAVADEAEFTQQDIDSANKVAVLGRTPVNNLFGDADPIGQTVRIKNVPFTVVGVLTAKGQSSQGQNQDDVILLPISSAKRKVIGSKQANAGGNRLWLFPCENGCLSGPDRGLALRIARFFARRGAEKGCVSGSDGSGAF